MRVIGLDIGERRIGVAISDPCGRVASPAAVLEASTLRDARDLARLVGDYDAGLVVIGLPTSLDGTEGPQARRVRELGARLAQGLPVPVVFADERLSSVEARRVLSRAGLDERQQRGRVDMVAAAVFLQGYLDARASKEEEEHDRE